MTKPGSEASLEWSRLRGRDYIISERFLRNRFIPRGKYGMPLIFKDEKIDIEHVKFLGFHNTKPCDCENLDRTIHFFIYDDKFELIYDKPYNSLEKLKQYKQILSPDFSIYTDMSLALQISNTFKRRWCSAFWQQEGLTVIPAVAWGDESSYDFCFDGIEEGGIIAVSPLGTGGQEAAFLNGFTEMCRRLKPEKVICYDREITGMGDIVEILVVPYEGKVRSDEKRESAGKKQRTLF